MEKVLTQNEIRKNRSMRRMPHGDSRHDSYDHGNYAEWVDAEETTNVERGIQLQPIEPEPFHRQHKDETRVNKEEKDPPVGQRHEPLARPAECPPDVNKEDRQNCE